MIDFIGFLLNVFGLILATYQHIFPFKGDPYFSSGAINAGGTTKTREYITWQSRSRIIVIIGAGCVFAGTVILGRAVIISLLSTLSAQ
ncbi:hypothetical protein [Pseudodesulfovibrio pelocollis]|uniref:hypothetical protein n=1 Tax=Pseudodesulfovibrio pelocollis TaxID=3051432 RepID=UPI00255AE31B|nr:hypothetical protein [Pseudodesulfovibrio sp. SB368]